MKYYKLDNKKSLAIIQTLENISDYNSLVTTWLKEHFTLEPNTRFYQFNDVPEFTQELIDSNPQLLKMMNKTNSRLSNRVQEGKELIESWKNHKIANGYRVNQSYTRADYAMILRTMFPYGSVKPVIDKQSNIVIVEVDEVREGFDEVTKKEFLELELKIENDGEDKQL